MAIRVSLTIRDARWIGALRILPAGLSVIYVAPIRAFLNNLEPSVQRYAQMVARRAFKWHGDVAAADKKRFAVDPSDILLTTPESLEVMLMSRTVPAARLFAGLRAVIIDAPPTVAAFLQRMGRTERRPQTVPTCTFLATEGKGLLVSDTQGLRLWTFAGGRANNLLGRVLESKLGEKVTARQPLHRVPRSGRTIRIRDPSGLAELRLESRPNHADALQFAESCARGRISKFQPCLPDRLEAEYLAEVLTSQARRNET